MQSEDGKKFTAVMTMLFELYDKPNSQPVLDLYWNSMRDWTLPEFEAAVQLLVKTSKFMPKPADFNELRNKVLLENSAEVWARVDRYLKYSPSGYTMADGTPPEIANAIRAAGGANTVGMRTYTEAQFLEKRFTEAYRSLVEVATARAALPTIPIMHLVEHEEG